MLYVSGLGASLEQPFWKAFLKALVQGLVVFGLILLTLAAAPEARARSGAPAIGILVAPFYLIVGLLVLRKARVWARRAGAVQRLIPHARGRAYGFLAAAFCQLGITIPLLLAKGSASHAP